MEKMIEKIAEENLKKPVDKDPTIAIPDASIANITKSTAKE